MVSQGSTKEEALSNLKEALHLFIVTCHEMGTLDEVMKDCGFSMMTGAVRPKEKTDSNTITIPVPFSVRGVRSAECRA